MVFEGLFNDEIFTEIFRPNSMTKFTDFRFGQRPWFNSFKEMYIYIFYLKKKKKKKTYKIRGKITQTRENGK